MESPFPRVGNKRHIQDRILPLIPPHRLYAEPFVGSGAIYFAKEPAMVSIINDLDESLIRAYRTMRNFGYDDYYTRYDTTNLERLNELFIEDNTDERHNLAKEIIKSNTFGSKGSGKLYKTSNPYNKLRKLDDYKEFMKSTVIKNEDYKHIVQFFDRDDAFFYLDPPYEHSIGLYDHDVIDLREMAELLKTLQGKFLLSLNHSKTVKEMFDSFNHKMIIVKGRNNWGTGSYARRELLISNYPFT